MIRKYNMVDGIDNEPAMIVDSTAISFNKDGAYTSEFSAIEAAIITRSNALATLAILGIKSNRTGQIAYYHRVTAKYNQDNELLYEKYVPTVDTIETMPQLKDTTLTVFND